MIKYEVYFNSIEIGYKSRRTIKAGVSIEVAFNLEPELVASFDNLEDAQAELNSKDTTITDLSGNAGTYYLVEEFYLAENEYDEDGDFVQQIAIHDFSKMEIDLVSESGEVIGTFDNMDDAEDALNAYDADGKLRY